MQLNAKIKINLLDFLKHGTFDYVELGNTKEWLIHNFADPDDFNESFYHKKSSIWRYGTIEFHFDDDKLYMIFSDYIHDLHGGEGLTLDTWIVSDSKKLTLSYVLEQLNDEHIEYTKINDDERIKLKLASGVVLGFDDVHVDNIDDNKPLSANQKQLSYFAFS